MHLEWLIPILAMLGYLYIRSRRPSDRFWRTAAKYPEAAYQWFTAETCWYIGDSRPSAEWSGPFMLYVPSLGRMIRIYGHYPDFEQSQQKFLARAKDATTQTV